MSRICDLESGRKYLVSIVSQMKMNMEIMKPKKEVMQEFDDGFKMAEMDDSVFEEIFGPVSVSHH